MIKNNILIASNDESFLRVLQDKLARKFLVLKFARNILDTIKLYEENNFDIVIIDGYLKEPNGNQISHCEFVEFLKNLKKESNTSFVLLSSVIEPEIEKECFRVGIDEVIFKPFRIEDFIIKINKILKNINLYKRYKDILTTNEVVLDVVSKIAVKKNILKTSKSEEYFNLAKNIFRSKLSPDGILLMERVDRNSVKAFIFVKSAKGFEEKIFSEKYLWNEIRGSGVIEYPNTQVESLLEKFIPKKLKLDNFYGIKGKDIFLLFINPEFEFKEKSVMKEFLKNLLLSFTFTKSFITDALEIGNSFKLLLISLAKASEANDEDTGEHVKRLRFYTEFILRKLIEKGIAQFSELEVELISHSAIVHDVGKINIDPNILFKRGRLTDEEMEEVKKHTIYGAKILEKHPNLRFAREIILTHHEKYDGSGYPFGLKGNEIPLSGRIVALCDVYDALRAERPYKRAFSHTEAVKIILEGDGRTLPEHFDPDILNIFREHHQEFDKIYKKSRLKKKGKELEIFDKKSFSKEDFFKLLE